jgi:hypothetical protein
MPPVPADVVASGTFPMPPEVVPEVPPEVVPDVPPEVPPDPPPDVPLDVWVSIASKPPEMPPLPAVFRTHVFVVLSQL